MSVRSFHSVFMVGGVAAAALSCYLVSLRVASERAALESVETEIVLAQRDIRLLQTEIGTRGRLAQLERWNVKVLALSAPSVDQFIPDSFQLARLVTPELKPAVEAPVVYASAPAAPAPGALQDGQESGSTPAAQLMHEASLKVPATASSSHKEAPSVPKPAQAPAAPREAKPVHAKASPSKTKPVHATAAGSKSKPAPAIVAKPSNAPAAKPAQLATADPLAPLPSTKKKAVPQANPATSSTSKDSGKTR